MVLDSGIGYSWPGPRVVGVVADGEGRHEQVCYYFAESPAELVDILSDSLITAMPSILSSTHQLQIISFNRTEAKFNFLSRIW